jgi:hypothetical protein
MAGEQPASGGAGYQRPRIIIAIGLAVLLAVLMIVDAGNPDYALGEVTLTILVGTILTLLGLELTDWLHR